jgi:plasmid stabilization system protein ParE
MRRGAVWRKKAEEDLLDAANFVAGADVVLAARFLDAVDAASERALTVPGIGEPGAHHRAGLEGLRAIRVRGFNEFSLHYRPILDWIEVVRVLRDDPDAAT